MCHTPVAAYYVSSPAPNTPLPLHSKPLSLPTILEIMNPTGLLERQSGSGQKKTERPKGLFIQAVLCSEHALWEATWGLSSGGGVLCQHHYGFSL